MAVVGVNHGYSFSAMGALYDTNYIQPIDESGSAARSTPPVVLR